MKTDMRKVDVPYYTYETCGKSNQTSIVIELCESKHLREACKHDGDFIYVPSTDGDLTITKKCANCKTALESKSLSEYILTEDECKEIWNVLADTNKP